MAFGSIKLDGSTTPFKQGDTVTNAISVSTHDDDKDIRMVIRKNSLFVVKKASKYTTYSGRTMAKYIFKMVDKPPVFLEIDSFTARGHGFRRIASK